MAQAIKNITVIKIKKIKKRASLAKTMGLQ